MKLKTFFFFGLLFVSSRLLWAQSVTKNVRVSFEIEPVTVIKVSSQAGVSAVRLGPLSPRADISPEPLEVSIMTNTRDRYRVYHVLREGVTNSAGTQFPFNRLLFMASSGTEGGKSEIPSFTKIPQDEIPIFTSKPEGGPDTFQIIYSVDNKELFSAGFYYGNIHIHLRNE